MKALQKNTVKREKHLNEKVHALEKQARILI